VFSTTNSLLFISFKQPVQLREEIISNLFLHVPHLQSCKTKYRFITFVQAYEGQQDGLGTKPEEIAFIQRCGATVKKKIAVFLPELKMNFLSLLVLAFEQLNMQP